MGCVFEWVVNILGKGENARNEQFLLFPQCFLLNLGPYSQTILKNILSIFRQDSQTEM